MNTETADGMEAPDHETETRTRRSLPIRILEEREPRGCDSWTWLTETPAFVRLSDAETWLEVHAEPGRRYRLVRDGGGVVVHEVRTRTVSREL